MKSAENIIRKEGFCGFITAPTCGMLSDKNANAMRLAEGPINFLTVYTKIPIEARFNIKLKQ